MASDQEIRQAANVLLSRKDALWDAMSAVPKDERSGHKVVQTVLYYLSNYHDENVTSSFFREKKFSQNPPQE